MKLINLFFLFLIVSLTAFPQSDPNAKKILDKLSEKNKSYKTIELEFTFTVENKEQKINETTKGVLKLKDDKYRVTMKEQEIFCNGKKIYTYSKETNEAQVIAVDELEADAITPKNMFTIYENNFKSRVKETIKEDGRTITVIDLYPTNPKEKDYSIVRLFVDAEKDQVLRANVLAKNGSLYVYKIDKITPNKELNDALFEFDKSKYPGVTVIE
ncbi:MAG: outer membrane lipoprotein carrier protein LolA [Flavobacteriales bacterium]|nr:outer membrane lipoprotein carrier protein LolA [Flavobacteriales bacterium]